MHKLDQSLEEDIFVEQYFEPFNALTLQEFLNSKYELEKLNFWSVLSVYSIDKEGLENKFKLES